MAAIATTLKRIIRAPALRRRSARGHFSLARTDGELRRAAFLLAHYGGRSVAVVGHLLDALWKLDTTALYVQIDGAASVIDLVLTPHPGQKIIAAGQKFRVETQTGEPAANGAYLTERQYRRLGFYETPPVERVVVLLRIEAGSGPTYVVDVPAYVRHVTVVVNDRLVAAAARIPAGGELRYRIAASPALA